MRNGQKVKTMIEWVHSDRGANVLKQTQKQSKATVEAFRAARELDPRRLDLSKTPK